MKYNSMAKLFGGVLGGIIKRDIKDKETRKAIKTEYKDIVLRADDIGEKNMLLSSYLLAAYFIAMNRKTNRTPEENIKTMDSGMRQSKLLRMLMGDAKHYFSEKKMEIRRAWSKDTYERKYKNDWVVDVLEKTDEYEFGLDYHECGVCKLCKDEGCPELAKYLCKLDFMLVEIIGVHLERTMTLADGYEKCDFRFSKN